MILLILWIKKQRFQIKNMYKVRKRKIAIYSTYINTQQKKNYYLTCNFTIV